MKKKQNQEKKFRTVKYSLYTLRVLVLLLFVTSFLTACVSSSEEMVLFRRKITRVDIPNQQLDTYSMDTTITQLISNEERTNVYNFSDNTRVAYETTFLTIPATLVYSFAAGGTLEKIEYLFDFSADTVEDDVESIYNECIKFFGYPDEGYTQGIYEYLYENPEAVWAKNNAEITLSYSMDENLDAHAVLSYYKSNVSGTSVAVFKLPFCDNTLGDGILSVVSSETKNNSETTTSIVEYVYQPEDTVLLSVSHVFKGETLRRIEMTLYSPDQSTRGMKGLNEEVIDYMDGRFADAFRLDESDEKAFDVEWSGEAAEISLYSTKDSGNREMLVTLTFSEYLN